MIWVIMVERIPEFFSPLKLFLDHYLTAQEKNYV